MATKLQEKLRCEREGREFIDMTLPVKPSDENTHYVKNSVLLEEILKCKERGELTDDAVKMFYNIATKLSSKLKYTNEDDRQDCIAQAMLDLCLYWDRFDPTVSDKPNPFAYYTSICQNAFAKAWRKLGKMKCPDSLVVSLSDNIYSL